MDHLNIWGRAESAVQEINELKYRTRKPLGQPIDVWASVAKKWGVSTRTIWRVRAILNNAPANVIEAVRGGDLSIYKAHRQINGFVDMAENELEDLICESLQFEGACLERQVYCLAGFADIVTSDTIYELKVTLTRANMFRSVGQVNCYRQCLGNQHSMVIACWQCNLPDELIAQIANMGIEIQVWGN